MGIFDRIKSTLGKGSEKAPEPANFGSNIKKAELGELPPLPSPGEAEKLEEPAMPPMEESAPEQQAEIQLPPIPEEQPESQPMAAEKPAVQKPVEAEKPAPKDEEAEEMEEKEDADKKLKPRLFIKVKRYKDLVKKTKDLKLMLDRVNESLSKIEEAKKVEQDKIAECRNIAKKLEESVKFFKDTFTKPVE